MISFKDKDAQTIKQNAYNTVKQLSTKQAVQQTKAKAKQQPVPEVSSLIAMYNEEIKKAIAEGNTALASYYNGLIAQLLNPTAQQQPAPQVTNEEEVPEDVQEEEVDETIDSDEIEI
jgi:hypothetical protein